MKIALAQIAPKLSKENMPLHRHYIQLACEQNAQAILFPELSLNGYKMMDVVFENAYELGELEPLLDLSHDIEIIVGCALKKQGAIYNASVVFGGGRIRHIHKKNHLPNYAMFEEARYFYAGEEIACFDGAGGRSVVLICEDLWRASTIERVSALAPDVIYVLANSPARDFLEDDLLIAMQWRSLLSSMAILSGASVVFANRVGFEDGVGYWGGSALVSPRGEVVLQAPLFEENLICVELCSHVSKVSKYIMRIK